MQSLISCAGDECLGQCLYVSGVPGTGKTATALEVVKDLRRRAAAGELPAFRFVELNALRLPSPQHAYCALLEVPLLRSPLKAGVAKCSVKMRLQIAVWRHMLRGDRNVMSNILRIGKRLLGCGQDLAGLAGADRVG